MFLRRTLAYFLAYSSVSQLHRSDPCEGRSALLISALHSPIKAVHPGVFSTYFHALSYFWDRVLAILDRRFHKFARVSSRSFAQHQPFEGGPALARALHEPLDRAAASQSVHEVDAS